MNLKRIMKRSIFALYPDLSHKGKWATMSSITNDRQHEQEIEFAGEEASPSTMNEAPVVRAAVQEHRGGLGLANPEEKVSEMEKDAIP